MAKKFWTTGTKRMFTLIAMVYSGYIGMSMLFPKLPQLPGFLTGKVIGIAVSGMLLYGAWMLGNNEI